MTIPRSPRFLKFFVVLAVVNFLSFAVFAVYLGGDAFSGGVIDGHYFLGYKGRMTEVSRAVFIYSRWHVISVFMTHSLAFWAGRNQKSTFISGTQI
jgi:hypothetical protein